MLKRILPIGIGMALVAVFAFAEVNDDLYHRTPPQTWLVTEEGLASQMAELKADVQIVRADNQALRAEMQRIQAGLQTLRAENQDLRARVQALQEDMQARVEQKETPKAR